MLGCLKRRPFVQLFLVTPKVVNVTPDKWDLLVMIVGRDHWCVTCVQSETPAPHSQDTIEGPLAPSCLHCHLTAGVLPEPSSVELS